MRMWWYLRSLHKAPAIRNVPQGRTLREGTTLWGVWWWYAGCLAEIAKVSLLWISTFALKNSLSRWWRTQIINDEAIITSTQHLWAPPQGKEGIHPSTYSFKSPPLCLSRITRHQSLTILSVFLKSEVFWMLKIIKCKTGSRKQWADKRFVNSCGMQILTVFQS